VEEARNELRELSNKLVSAQEEERRHVARELHDEVGQSMAALLVEIGRLESAAAGGDLWRERLASIRAMAESLVRTVRNIALLLRPSMLDDLGLVSAIHWQAREVSRRTGLKVVVSADEIAESMPDSRRTCFYRFVQEALNNCVRHARATEARVSVRQDHDAVLVSVRDDGVGFHAPHNKGLGLLGMEERATRLGGVFHVDSQPGRGAELSMRFPLLDESAAVLERL
jgi:signal transduction histidine kinase